MIMVSALSAGDAQRDEPRACDAIPAAARGRWRPAWIINRFWRDLEIVLRWIFLDAAERRSHPLGARIRRRRNSAPVAAPPAIVAPPARRKLEVLVCGRAKCADRVLRCLLSEDVALHAIAADPGEARDLVAMGVAPHRLQDMPDQAARFDVIVSTDLMQFVGAEVLARLPENAVILDLAPPPGSVDYESAKFFGRKAIWARSALSEGRPVFCPETWAKVRRALDASRNDR